MKSSVEKNGPATRSAPDGALEMADSPPPPSIVTLLAPQPDEPIPFVKQPSFPGARPRRSCLRRQSTATTVCSAAAEIAVGEVGYSDELKVHVTLDDVGGRQGVAPPAPVIPIPRSVSFSEKAAVQEYGMILGDHPCVDRGPPLTMSWEVQNAYQQQVIDHQSPRRGVQLRIPANLRTEVVSVTASEAEISKATFEVRKLRSQRHTTVAMQELEGFQILWQSAVRKVQRWQRKKRLQRSTSIAESSTTTSLPLDAFSPAEAWLEANTLRRGGKLVLKPGVVPYDRSTALAVDDERAEECSPLSTGSGSVEGGTDSHAGPEASKRGWQSVSQPQAQHLRKASEDDSQETAPTVVSTLDEDASATDDEEVHDLARTILPAMGGEILP